MEIKDIVKLIEAVSAHGLTSFELEENGTHLAMKKEVPAEKADVSSGSEAGTAAAMASAAMASATMANAAIANTAMASAAAPLVAGSNSPVRLGAAMAGQMAVEMKSEGSGAVGQEAGGAANAGDSIGSDKIVTSPLVGTFYDSPSPEADSFVKVGDVVKKGQVLGIIEAMKLMNEIESEFDGVVEAVLVKSEDVVEYGQPLFRIR